MKPLCWEPLEVLVSVASYQWLSSVACAELCARQNGPVPAKSKCAQHRQLAFNDTLGPSKPEQKTTATRSDRSASQLHHRNGVSID